ncbi:hypothetical protein EV215_0070 [Hypnocyclicus thermotrophus]|uniref:Uncharacterized protein n=1 Tax=Hypnocyclicus thermotrophus TaxID=1627895 RepID=A0AA46I6F7_9FUSO|nr:hypothetical protein [Hypnocyclicus thermotrophus]TDT72282.1 hypothetical protein EV215_0070 [Hypnocyclicus thermotrophus]
MMIDIIEEFRHRKEKNETLSDILNLFISDCSLIKEFKNRKESNNTNFNDYLYY